jgi:hypothetical protein
MRNLLNTGLLILCIGLTGQVNGQTNRPEGKSCNSQTGRIQFIQEFSSTYFDNLLRNVERVPPDIEKYLQDEYQDSIRLKNESRYQKVVNNQYYFPWKLRDSESKFRDEVKNGFIRELGYGSFKKNPHESEIIYYINLLYKVSDVLESYDEYKIFDRQRSKPFLDPNKDSYLRGFSKDIYKIVIQDLVSCYFKK